MKSGRLLTLVVAGMLVTGYWLLRPGQAQAPVQPRSMIGVVNVLEVFNSSEEIKALKKEMEDKKTHLEIEARDRQAKLRGLEDVLNKTNVGSKDYKIRRDELMHEKIAYRNWADETQADLSAEHVARMADFYQRMCAAVEEMAKPNGLNLDVVLSYEESLAKEATTPPDLLDLIRLRQVLHRSVGADITSVVLKKMNADFAAHPVVPK